MSAGREMSASEAKELRRLTDAFWALAKRLEVKATLKMTFADGTRIEETNRQPRKRREEEP